MFIHSCTGGSCRRVRETIDPFAIRHFRNFNSFKNLDLINIQSDARGSIAEEDNDEMMGILPSTLKTKAKFILGSVLTWHS